MQTTKKSALLFDQVKISVESATSFYKAELAARSEFAAVEPGASDPTEARTSRGISCATQMAQKSAERSEAFERARVAFLELEELAARLEGESNAAGGRGPVAAAASKARSALSSAWDLIKSAVAAGVGSWPKKD